MNLLAPLFIIGNPRSGTSLLRLVLTCHSQILIPPECGFIVWLKDKYAAWNCYNNNAEKLSFFLDDLLMCKKFETWGLDRGALEAAIMSRFPCSYAELCGAVHLAYGEHVGRSFSIWGDKNNFHVRHINDLHKIYKSARFLHIVRDGRDVASSYRAVMEIKTHSQYAPNLNTDISNIANEWNHNVMAVDIAMGVLPSAQALTIRYEDFANNPMETIKLVIDWLGFSYENDMLSFYIHNREKKLEPDLTFDWKKRTVEAISPDTVGRYRACLVSDEIRCFEEIAASALRRFEYL